MVLHISKPVRFGMSETNFATSTRKSSTLGLTLTERDFEQIPGLAAIRERPFNVSPQLYNPKLLNAGDRLNITAVHHRGKPGTIEVHKIVMPAQSNYMFEDYSSGDFLEFKVVPIVQTELRVC
jgi:hypothetical protein